MARRGTTESHHCYFAQTSGICFDDGVDEVCCPDRHREDGRLGDLTFCESGGDGGGDAACDVDCRWCFG